MKYLFLDIDGVLNTSRFQEALKESGRPLFDDDGALFDPNAVNNLRSIIDKTSAKIVLTSTWRLDGIEAMRDMWKRRQMPSYIMGLTPHSITKFADIDTHDEWSKHAIGSRGIEVNEWLRKNTKGSNTYAILDDENDYLLFQAKHIVLTDPFMGITNEIANRVIEILK